MDSLKWKNAVIIRVEKPAMYVRNIRPTCARNVLSVAILKYTVNSARLVPFGLWTKGRSAWMKTNNPSKSQKIKNYHKTCVT